MKTIAHNRFEIARLCSIYLDYCTRNKETGPLKYKNFLSNGYSSECDQANLLRIFWRMAFSENLLFSLFFIFLILFRQPTASIAILHDRNGGEMLSCHKYSSVNGVQPQYILVRTELSYFPKFWFAELCVRY